MKPNSTIAAVLLFCAPIGAWAAPKQTSKHPAKEVKAVTHATVQGTEKVGKTAAHGVKSGAKAVENGVKKVTH